MDALIFDCDGVLADTERDGHRVAFNRAFAEAGLSFTWDVPLYARLVRIGGGKERMTQFFDEVGWPVRPSEQDALISRLHALKTDLFVDQVESGELSIRSGINRMVDEAYAAGIRLAICSTSTERSVIGIVRRLLGAERHARFAGIFAGDTVAKKKPDPSIYNFAATKLQLDPTRCLVVEDSRNGLLAAVRAGMMCVITKSAYTANEDFTEAAAVYSGLGDPPGSHVTLDELANLIKSRP